MLELSAEILRPLIDDALVIVEDEVVIIGRGPLSQLIRKLRGLRVPYAFFIWLLSPLLTGLTVTAKAMTLARCTLRTRR